MSRAATKPSKRAVLDAEAIAKAQLAKAVASVKSARVREVNALYEAAAAGRRTAGWRTSLLDANAENWQAISRLRQVAHDLVRNNAYARKAKTSIQNNVVGSGIVPRITGGNAAIIKAVKKHFDGTAIHNAGRLNLAGIQNVGMGQVVEGGEFLVRMRPRLLSDGLPLPFQLQVLPSEYLDHLKNGPVDNGNIAISGVEFDKLGRRVAYWLFPVHPGSMVATTEGRTSQRVDAKYIAHIHRVESDAEEVRGMSWFAPVIVRMRDFADFADAQLMRQKIAACFAVFITSNEDAGVTLTDDPNETYPLESVEPGMINRLKLGEGVEFGNPPGVQDFASYSGVTLHEIAAGLGITYEALTGDLTGVNYSSGRMGWLEYQRNIDAWRWLMLIPQFLDRLTEWTNQAIKLQFGGAAREIDIAWTPPRREMIDPTVELEAAGKSIRLGLTSRSEEVRRLGYDPEEVDAELASDNERADRLGLALDSDPRRVAGNGRWQQAPAGEPVQPGHEKGAPEPAPPPPAPAPAKNMQLDLFALQLASIEARLANPAPASPGFGIVLDEKHINVDATRPQIMTPETYDEKGRLLSAIIRPKSGKGAVMRRVFAWAPDANGTLRPNGSEDHIIEEPANG